MDSKTLNTLVFTPHGKGEIIATFDDGTVCVRLEHGGGIILHKEEVFERPSKKIRCLPSRMHYGDETGTLALKSGKRQHKQLVLAEVGR